MTRTLIVMVKAPVAGRVKTRLAHYIGPVAAAWWYRHQLVGLLRRLRDPRWRLVLAVAPDRAAGASYWPEDIPRVAQGRGDLGARMARLLRRPGQVLVIGSDIPTVDKPHIWRAFRVLGGADTVFGPAEDGGFWLVGAGGARALPPGLFCDVRWSGPHALSDSIRTLKGASVACADILRDVDTVDDLHAFRHDGTHGA